MMKESDRYIGIPTFVKINIIKESAIALIDMWLNSIIVFQWMVCLLLIEGREEIIVRDVFKSLILCMWIFFIIIKIGIAFWRENVWLQYPFSIIGFGVGFGAGYIMFRHSEHYLLEFRIDTSIRVLVSFIVWKLIFYAIMTFLQKRDINKQI